jgi:hypothetical protein
LLFLSGCILASTSRSEKFLANPTETPVPENSQNRVIPKQPSAVLPTSMPCLSDLTTKPVPQPQKLSLLYDFPSHRESLDTGLSRKFSPDGTSAESQPFTPARPEIADGRPNIADEKPASLPAESQAPPVARETVAKDMPPGHTPAYSSPEEKKTALDFIEPGATCSALQLTPEVMPALETFPFHLVSEAGQTEDWGFWCLSPEFLFPDPCSLLPVRHYWK